MLAFEKRPGQFENFGLIEMELKFFMEQVGDPPRMETTAKAILALGVYGFGTQFRDRLCLRFRSSPLGFFS